MAGDIISTKNLTVHEYDQHNSESRNILIYTDGFSQQHYLFDDTKNPDIRSGFRPDIRNIKNLVDIW